MKNFLDSGDIVSINAPYALASGQGALVGATFGIACGDAAINTPVQLKRTGRFTHAKATGASTNVALGGIVYWDNAARLMTGVASGNTKIGVATAAAATGDASITVILVPTI